jgi:hypothetical protein
MMTVSTRVQHTSKQALFCGVQETFFSDRSLDGSRQARKSLCRREEQEHYRSISNIPSGISFG